MPNPRWDLQDAQNFTINLTGLASSSAGVGVQSALENNTGYKGARVYLELTTTSTPTVDTSFLVYYLESSDDANPIIADGAQSGTGALTVLNSDLLGSFKCDSATPGKYRGIFDTTDLIEQLGSSWGIAVVQDTGQNLDTTGNLAKFRYHSPEVQ